MIREIYGKKIGITQTFDEEGNLVATTLIEVEPVYALEKVDYPAKTKLKIGVFKIPDNKVNRLKKPLKGYFDKLGISPYKFIKEVEVEEGADLSFEPAPPQTPPETEGEKAEVKEEKAEGKEEETEGKEEKVEESDQEKPKEEQQPEPADPRQIGVTIFNAGDIVDVRAPSKGKGFAGGMKRHGWSGQPKSHGSTMHRRIGSAGASAYPSRVIKGLGMPGHMGNVFCTVKNLKVLKVDTAKDLLFVEGNIPGSRGAMVRIRKVK